MTTPYLKDTTGKRQLTTRVTNDYIQSGDYVRFTGAYDSAGTAIYDGDVLVYIDGGTRNTFTIYFCTKQLMWMALANNSYKSKWGLCTLLHKHKDLIVRPPKSKDDTESTDTTAALEARLKQVEEQLEEVVKCRDAGERAYTQLQKRLENMTHSRDKWKRSFTHELDINRKIRELEYKVKSEQSKNPQPIQAKYEVEYVGFGYLSLVPVFKIGCRTDEYNWFINHWNDPNYSGTLSPDEIPIQKAALIDEYRRVTGKYPE